MVNSFGKVKTPTVFSTGVHFHAEVTFW
jgi:hypothetical protein